MLALGNTCRFQESKGEGHVQEEGRCARRTIHVKISILCLAFAELYFDSMDFNVLTHEISMMHRASLPNKLELQALLFLFLFCSVCLKCYEICALDAHCP